MKNFYVSFSVGVISLLISGCSTLPPPLPSSSSFSNPISSDQMGLIMLLSSQYPPIVRQAFKEEAFRRAKTTQDIHNIQNQIQKAFQKFLVAHKNFPMEYTLAQLKQRVLKRVQRDLTMSQVLNQYLETSGASSKDLPKVSYSCKTNKLPIILQGTQALLEKHFVLLLSGGTPYNLQTFSINKLGGGIDGNVHGHSNITFFKTALLNILLELESGNAMGTPNVEKFALLYPSFLHLTPLPKGFMGTTLHPHFNQFTYFCKGAEKDNASSGKLAFTHSGYAFGGTRGEPSSMYVSHGLAPTDCSEWIAKLLKSSAPFAVHHMMGYWNVAFKVGYQDPAFGQKDPYYQAIMNVMTPIRVEKISDVKPGYIFAYKNFDVKSDPSMNQSLGGGGHVVLVVGTDLRDQQLITLGYARDMPRYEGFGLMKFPFSPAPHQKYMFFVPKQQTSSQGRFR